MQKNDIDYLLLVTFVEGALRAFMSSNPNETEEVLFHRSVTLMIKNFWNEKGYIVPIVRFLLDFKVNVSQLECDDEIINAINKHFQAPNIGLVCVKCGGEMQKGKALQNDWVYFNDFGNDAGQRGTTMSRQGPALMRDVCKCKSCGHSFIPKEQV